MPGESRKNTSSPWFHRVPWFIFEKSVENGQNRAFFEFPENIEKQGSGANFEKFIPKSTDLPRAELARQSTSLIFLDFLKIVRPCESSSAAKKIQITNMTFLITDLCRDFWSKFLRIFARSIIPKQEVGEASPSRFDRLFDLSSHNNPLVSA